MILCLAMQINCPKMGSQVTSLAESGCQAEREKERCIEDLLERATERRETITQGLMHNRRLAASGKRERETGSRLQVSCSVHPPASS